MIDAEKLDLQEIATKLYGVSIPISDNTSASGLTVANLSIFQALGSPKSTVYFWSSEEANGAQAHYRNFSESGTYVHYNNRSISSYKAFCVEK